MRLTTKLTHHSIEANTPKNPPFLQPTYETVSFSMPSVEAWEELLLKGKPGWVYHSDANPTVRALERMLASVRGSEECYVTSTGKSAIAGSLLASLSAGSSVIIFREGYKSTRLFCEGILQKFGVKTLLASAEEDLETLLERERPEMLVLESPTNPMTRVLDLDRLTKLAHRYDAKVLLDVSQAGLHQFCEIPGDVMGGAVLGDADVVQRIRNTNCWNADAMSAASATVLLRGMHTYELRIERQSSNAMSIAKELERHPAVRRVLYPGLPSHPDHLVAKRLMEDFGSVLVIDLEGGEEQARNFLNALRIFRLSFGTGFTQSIAGPAWLFYARSFPREEIGDSTIGPTHIRLYIGIENVEVLLADLFQALAQTHNIGSEHATTQ